jgi:hypothetical protein
MWQAAFETAAAIILSLGGGAAIVLSCAGWLGKVWANRILEQDRAKYTRELEHLKSQFETSHRVLQGELDKTVHAHRIQFETEFQILKEVWGKLALARTAMAEVRPHGDYVNPGETHEQRLAPRRVKLSGAYTAFMRAIDDHSPFYPEEIFRELQSALECTRHELNDTEVLPEPTTRSQWFQEAETNMRQFGAHANKASELIRRRLEALRVAGHEPHLT